VSLPGSTNGTAAFGSPISAFAPSWRYSSGTVGTRFKYCAGIIWSVSMLSRTT
jgi:hypothetical protein